MCMYSKGLVTYIMYHSGRGMILTVRVLMYDRHRLHRGLLSRARDTVQTEMVAKLDESVLDGSVSVIPLVAQGHHDVGHWVVR